MSNSNLATETSRKLALRYFQEILSAGKLDVIEEIMAPDVIFHIPTIPGGVKGSAAYRNFVIGLRSAFPHGVFTPVRHIAEGEKAGVLWTFRGTSEGAFLGIPPTGKVVTDYGIDILHFSGGKITEIWANEDAMGLLQQLGAIPSSAPHSDANVPGPAPTGLPGPGGVQANKQIVDRYFSEIMNAARLDAAVQELIATDCVFTIPTLPQPFDGPEGYRQLVLLLRKAFPDLEFTSLDMLAEGDVVVDRWLATGTSLGEFNGAQPTGKRFVIQGIGWYRLKDGKFLENRVNEDTIGLLTQIGALPGPDSANVTLARRFWNEIWNQGKFDVIVDIVAPEFVLYLPAQEMRGPDGLKLWASLIRGGLPDVNFTIEQIVDGGSTVATRWTATGTHTGNLLGYPPTGRSVRMSGISIFTFANGKIVEDRAAEDAYGLLTQIGAVPPPPAPGMPDALFVLPNEGKSITSLDSTLTIKCGAKETFGTWALTHLTVPPHFVQQAPPPHFHTRDEEAFYILDGTITFWINGQDRLAPKGTFVKMPRYLLHKFSNPSDTPAAMLVIGAPAGVETFLWEIYELFAKTSTPEIGQIVEIFARYGLVIPPPPHQP